MICVKCKREISTGDAYYEDVTHGQAGHLDCGTPTKQWHATQEAATITTLMARVKLLEAERDTLRGLLAEWDDETPTLPSDSTQCPYCYRYLVRGKHGNNCLRIRTRAALDGDE